MTCLSVWDGSAVTVLARVLGQDAEPIVQSSLTGIVCKVIDRITGEEIEPAPTVVVSSTVFDTLQDNDPRWTFDDVGYNFAHLVDSTYFTAASSLVRIVYTFTPVAGSGQNFRLVVDVDVVETLA